MDFRIQYDVTKLETSNILTNEAITNEDREKNVKDYFKFEDKFLGILEYDNRYGDDDVIKDENGVIRNDIIRTQISFEPPIGEADHVIPIEDGSKVLSTQGGVLLGKMSFRMLTNDPFDISGFKVIPSSYSPETGIKINIDGTYYYQKYNPTENTDKLLLRFTDATASKNADLSNIVLSTGEINGENPEESTYKQYNYTPTFNSNTKKYELTLLEYIDTMDITATLSDTKSKMKIKIPEHDTDGNLVYDSDDRTTITYKEENLSHNVPFGVTLNKLGEPNTKITILVTAEDGQTTNEYEVLIKRPYATIRGSVVTESTIASNKHEASIRLYNSSDVASVINWGNLTQGKADDTHDKLVALKSQDFETNIDGTYTLYVIPGTYDILLDKTSYLDCIFTSRELRENDVLDLGEKILYAGDINKDGVINARDKAYLNNQYGYTAANESFDVAYDLDENGTIAARDIAYINNNYLMNREID